MRDAQIPDPYTADQDTQELEERAWARLRDSRRPEAAGRWLAVGSGIAWQAGPGSVAGAGERRERRHAVPARARDEARERSSAGDEPRPLAHKG